MSHMVSVKDIEITSLSALQKACERIGAKLNTNRKQATYFAGRTAAVDATIDVPGSKWQIGLVKNENSSYELQADFYGVEGGKLKAVVDKLKQYYPIEVAKEVARKKGYTVTEKHLQNGAIKLILS